jgi:hypothetical protein
LNLAGLGYFFWLGFEVSVLRHGLLRSVTYLLLFTALAKLASLKTAGEARTALLVLFLLTLAAASSSTHYSSLFYFAAIALLGFRALARLAVLADFSEAPPQRVLRSVPTPAVSAAGLAAAAALCAPLFYGLPRLKGPYAIAPFRLDDGLTTALTADRVDLESFGAAKRSDRVVLRLTTAPEDRPRVVRLREAVFTVYRDGVWTRRPSPGRGETYPSGSHRGREPVRIDLALFAKGFLFLPYGIDSVRLEAGRSAYVLPDGLLQATSGPRNVRYEVGLAGPSPCAESARRRSIRGRFRRRSPSTPRSSRTAKRTRRRSTVGSRSACARASSTRSIRRPRGAIRWWTSSSGRARDTASTSPPPRR